MIFRESSDRQTFRRFFGNPSAQTTVQTESRRNFPPVRFLRFFHRLPPEVCFAAEKPAKQAGTDRNGNVSSNR